MSLEIIGKIFQIHSSMRFSISGFGAISGGAVSHQFPLGDGICDGVLGLLTSYGKTVQQGGITMSGPKLLRRTIDAAIERAIQNSQWKLSYTVLVILCCDGKIGDYEEVMEKISQASYIPLSIIFVGVGDGEFEGWDVFKRENTGVLTSPSGNEYMRDVAHFVQLKKYFGKENDFVRKLVEKIPSQLVQYHLSNGIFPPTDESNSVDDSPEQPQKRPEFHSSSSTKSRASSSRASTNSATGTDDLLSFS